MLSTVRCLAQCGRRIVARQTSGPRLAPVTAAVRLPVLGNMQSVRFMGSARLSDDEVRRALNEMNDLFVEARDEIEGAQESIGTVYFNEEIEIAQEAVDAALDNYRQLIDSIGDEDQRGEIQRANGLKMEQLKGELKMVLDAAADD